VNSAITFNNQVGFSAEEVGKVITKLMLATKLEAQELPISKLSHNNPSADVSAFRSFRARRFVLLFDNRHDSAAASSSQFRGGSLAPSPSGRGLG
jgi:hypothetical protein